jgi:hypothetical protein
MMFAPREDRTQGSLEDPARSLSPSVDGLDSLECCDLGPKAASSSLTPAIGQVKGSLPSPKEPLNQSGAPTSSPERTSGSSKASVVASKAALGDASDRAGHPKEPRTEAELRLARFKVPAKGINSLM